jgi:hypothetical protein
MPRTVYWQRFREALQRNSRFTPVEGEADLLFPAEDTALETNWPRYANPGSAYVRGKLDEPTIMRYLNRLVVERGPFCVVSMFPSMRLAWGYTPCQHVAVADVSMSTWERALNPRTISMPTLPITAPASFPAAPAPQGRDILASFRGTASHPCRHQLAALHDGRRFVVQLIPLENHAGKVDATTGAQDAGYVDLMRRSVFAFVPRGDSLFSYRLAEALAWGCIPIVLSDGWMLPFDRQISWASAALHVPESLIPAMGDLLSKFPPDRIAALQAEGQRVYRRHFSSIDAEVESLLVELERAFNFPSVAQGAKASSTVGGAV